MTSMPASRMPRRPASASRAASPGRWCGPARRRAPRLGRRAMTASVSISSTTTPRYSMRTPGDDLEAVEQLPGARPAVGLDEADHEVGAAFHAPVPLLEHARTSCRPRAPCPGRRAGCRAQAGRARRCARASARRSGRWSTPATRSWLSEPVQVEVDLEHVDRSGPRRPSSGCSVCRSMAAWTSATGMPRAAAMRSAWYAGSLGADVRIEPGPRGWSRGPPGPGASPWAARRRSTSAVTRSMSFWLVGARLEPDDALAS